MPGIRLQPDFPATARYARRGLTLVELMVAISIIAVALIPLSGMVIRSSLNFAESRNSIDGHWMASQIMHTLVSQELPVFDDDGNGSMTYGGNCLDFLTDAGVDTEQFSEAMKRKFEQWEYEYTKEVVILNQERMYEPLEDGTAPDFEGQEDFGSSSYDSSGRFVDDQELAAEDLQAMPAARIIRIKLVLQFPGELLQNREYEEEDLRSTEAGAPDKITLITFVDADDFKAEVGDQDPFDEAAAKEGDEDGKGKGGGAQPAGAGDNNAGDGTNGNAPGNQ